ncbi:FAD-binding domain-containing protein [Xylariaceae sp. FL1272]|nr:FAD-binding domain-containing protein [Xylariaceae sp. FL1272]
MPSSYHRVAYLTILLWDRLNATLQGRLKEARPLAAPCYDDPDGPQCALLKNGLGRDADGIRTDSLPGFINIQGEACIVQPIEQCLLNATSLEPFPNTTCRQGLVPPRYLEVLGPSDVQAAFAFARETGISISVKNTGHDFAMRSSSAGSLALWTRGLRKTTYSKSFVPSGCPRGTKSAPALTLGAGVSTQEAMDFAKEKGVLFVGANSPSVGASGGWLLNGGHSALSGSYGLAVDRVLQFTIVTPDGIHREVNACSDAELFWSLRGGGGGTFGVVLDSTFATEPASTVVSIVLTFSPDVDGKKRFLNILADHILFNDHPDFYDYWSTVLNGIFGRYSAVSTAEVPSDWTIPVETLENSTSKTSLVDSIVEAEAQGLTIAMLLSTPFLYGQSPQAGKNTSMHPVWYRSIWVLGAIATWPSGSPLSSIRQSGLLIRNVTESWQAIAPTGCAYSNEANLWLGNWARHFWGTNYQRLLRAKMMVDPHGLLHCWRCVGWDQRVEHECVPRLD